ncbi:hypothetical protein RFI_29959 [Reticulomyxa filosa]|uniref:Amino acid transporter transmembrane domain-containing protein n=1 Tax=Reticulomyxa filosa TaxID=46433 RepID=X6M333_RETFI|nr:hypothetical protein RFI_29959 [Reticulomyxa filosa]|eukprot:ETO07425.1 hypothetical protein RFI_29959 [Reticulomyxa filosa]
MAGPALVLLPSLFQEAGYLPVSIVLIITAILSGIDGWMLTEALRRIPGNHDLSLHAEYTSLLEHYLPKTAHKCCLMVYLLSLMSLLMSNIIQSAQVTDLAIRDMFGCSYGLELYGYHHESETTHVMRLICGEIKHNITPFEDNSIVLSSGFILLGLICMMFSNKNLNDNIILQWIANIGLCVLVSIWLYVFSKQKTFDSHRIPFATWRFDHVLGVVLFNFAFIGKFIFVYCYHYNLTNVLIISYYYYFFFFFLN